MNVKFSLELEKCQAAVNAMIAELKEGPSNPPLGIAIVDSTGTLVTMARTDGAGPLLVKNSFKKAYTSALWGMSTEELSEFMKKVGWTIADMGDSNLLDVSGGVPIRDPSDNKVLGGIGVGGLPYGPGDHDICLAGLRAIGLPDSAGPSKMAR